MEADELGVFVHGCTNLDAEWWQAWNHHFCRFMNQNDRWKAFRVPMTPQTPMRYFDCLWIPLSNPKQGVMPELGVDTLLTPQEFKSHLTMNYIPVLTRYSLDINLWFRRTHHVPDLASLIQMAVDEDGALYQLKMKGYDWGSIMVVIHGNASTYFVTPYYPQQPEVWEAIAFMDLTLLPRDLEDLVAVHLVATTDHVKSTRVWQRLRQLN